MDRKSAYYMFVKISPFTADKMWISVLTSSLVCLSKVQFHMCSFPRSNCQFLEHRHFTTQEREENNCRFLPLQFAPSWQGQERSCLQEQVYTRRNLTYGLHLLQLHPYPNLFGAKHSCGQHIFLLCLLFMQVHRLNAPCVFVLFYSFHPKYPFFCTLFLLL